MSGPAFRGGPESTTDTTPSTADTVQLFDATTHAPKQSTIANVMAAAGGAEISVVTATTTNGTITTAFDNASSLDGVTLATGDYILIKNQSDATVNGVYRVNASGAPTRIPGYDTGASLVGLTIKVRQGTANADTEWLITNDSITLGSDSIAVTQTSGLRATRFFVPAGAFAKVGTTAGWVVGAADNVNLATLPASQTASTLVLPIPGMLVGDVITSFNVLGQIESAGGTVTLDADLRKQTAAAADVTDASIGAITQLSVTADTQVDSGNTLKTLATPETVSSLETFYILVTGTTGGSTDIALQGAVLWVNRLG